MGFFDSKKTTKNTNVTNDYTTNNVDNSYQENDLASGAIGVSGDIGGALNINTSDMGAIAAGQELAMASLDYGADSLELGYGLAGETLAFSKDALADSIEQISGSAEDFAQLTQRSLEQTQTAYREANTSEDGRLSERMTLYLAIVVALWLLTPVLGKMFKG